MSSFAALNLHPNISKAITACGFSEPTPIQSQSIPSILAGKDLVASSQTGTGKTAAFVLPALQRLSEQPSKKTRVLILTPTRELATQITKAAHEFGKFLRFNIVSLVGGMPYHNQIKDLARGADIIVATPGRLMDHMEQKRVDLSGIEMLVLDEADRMSDMGFIDDVQYIAKLTPANRQTLLFSATIDKQLTVVVRHLLKNPVRIDLSENVIAAPQIKQELYKTSGPQHKLRLLKHFLNDTNIYKAIIFSSTKINVDKLAAQLCHEGFPAAPLHGDLKQRVRTRTVDQLRRGKIQYLVATDVAARGIDISDITHVFNYDMPKFCEDYVHRIGRTGRAGKSGVAISFVLPTDMRHLQRIERFIGQRLQVIQQVEINESSVPRQPVEIDLDDMPKQDRRQKYDRESGGHFHKKKRFSSGGKKSFPEKNQERHSERNSERRSERFSERSSERRPERFSERSSERRPERFSERNSEKRPERFSERSSERRPGRFSERSSERRPERFSERSSERRPERLSERSSERRPERFSERSSERRSERPSERNSERRPERRSERNSESRSERRPERLSERQSEKKPRKKSFARPQAANGDFARKRSAKNRQRG